jgi:hypothetical protein
MKKQFLIFGVALLLLIGTSNSALAYSFGIETFTGTYMYGNSNAGTYLGTVYDANDNTAILIDFLNNFAGLGVTSVSIYGKSDEGTLFIPDSETNSDGQLISGTWQTSAPPTPPTDTIDILVVKGGTSFSVHQYIPAAPSGEWNIGRLADAGGSGGPAALSHLSAYLGPDTSAPVPEPTTILLIGMGLFGIVAAGKKRVFKKQS